MPVKSPIIRILSGAVAVVGLASVYIFQDSAWLAAMLPENPKTAFLVAKCCRFLSNDALTILLIWSLFPTRGHLLAALLVQLAGLVFILIPYLVLKLGFDAGNGPLVSFLHRLVLNPTLLLLMIPAFFYLVPVARGRGVSSPTNPADITKNTEKGPSGNPNKYLNPSS